MGGSPSEIKRKRQKMCKMAPCCRSTLTDSRNHTVTYVWLDRWNFLWPEYNERRDNSDNNLLT